MANDVRGHVARRLISVLACLVLLAGCGLRSPITFRAPYATDVDAAALLPAGATVEWTYLDAWFSSGCPDPFNPGADPGCRVARFMAWDGTAWHDAGLVPGSTTNETYQFTFPDPVDEASLKLSACNDIGTVAGAWDQEDNCSTFGGALLVINGPVNPRFLP